MQDEMKALAGRLKEQHRQVFASLVGEDLFLWRPLGRKEYRRIATDAVSEHDLQERLCQAAVLWPEALDFTTIKAGVPGALAPIIREESGYGSPDKAFALLDEYRAEMEAFEYQAEATIAKAFPQYRFEEMEDWTFDELMHKLVRAEWALQRIDGRGIEFRPMQPEEGEAAEPPTTSEVAANLREQGIDPMFALVNPKTLRPPFVTMPLIAGTRWQDEVNLNGVREQVQKRLGNPDAEGRE